MRRHIFVLLVIAVLFAGGCSKKIATGGGENHSLLKGVPYSYTYVDTSGNLRLKNPAGESDVILIEGEFKNSPDYAVNWRERLVAYVFADDQHFGREFVLYNVKTHERKILSEDAHVGNVAWSPNGRYLLLDVGTYVWRAAAVYDCITDTLTPLPVALWLEDRRSTWSPDGSKIAAGVEETVDPPTPVSEGESVTTVVIDIENNNETQTLIKGTREFYTVPYAWVNDHTLVVKSTEYHSHVVKYIEINYLQGTQRETVPPEAAGNLTIPQEILRYQHDISPDGEYVLFTQDGVIKIWFRETGRTLPLTESFNMEWISD